MVENLIEAMVDAVVLVDVDGRITRSNTAASQISGYSEDELKHVPISKLLIDDRSGLRSVVRRRIEDGGVLRREQSWLVTTAGERIPVSVTGSPVLDSNGSVLGIVLVARDVREIRKLLADKESEILRRRSAEQELRAANSSIEVQLEQSRMQLLLAERRATLGTLAGGVGHELRNIAQIQVASVEEISAALAAGEDMAAVMRAILPDLERVSEHITQHGSRLLQLARPGPDRVAPIDLSVVVHDVISMLRGAGKLRRIDVVTNVGSDPLTVTVNRTRIEQIMVNLVVNAVDAIGDKPGKISLDIRRTPDGSRIVCEVADNGSGIPPDELDKVFEPFFTTKPEELGTGLGLPVARTIVQSYGGDLVVKSDLGVGTTFTFDLPR